MTENSGFFYVAFLDYNCKPDIKMLTDSKSEKMLEILWCSPDFKRGTIYAIRRKCMILFPV